MYRVKRTCLELRKRIGVRALLGFEHSTWLVNGYSQSVHTVACVELHVRLDSPTWESSYNCQGSGGDGGVVVVVAVCACATTATAQQPSGAAALGHACSKEHAHVLLARLRQSCLHSGAGGRNNDAHWPSGEIRSRTRALSFRLNVRCLWLQRLL